MDIGELLPVASGVLTNLATQIITAAPGWALRRVRGSKESAALVKVIADSLGQAFLDARGTDAVDADWILAVAREWEPAFSPAACTRLLSVLRGEDAGDAFRQEAVRALEDAGADLTELGRLLDVAEFLHVLPRRVFDGLRSAALAPDSELRDLVDALLRQEPVTAAEATLRAASPREFAADLTELLTVIETRAVYQNMPRFTPPGATINSLTRGFRVLRAMRAEQHRAGAPAADPYELVMPGEELPVLDWAEVTSHDDRVVLLGDPGMGKSWLIRWETARLARAALDALRSGADPGEVIVPVPLRCDEIIASGATVTEAVLGFLLARYPVPQRSQRRLRALIESGNIMLLLDALDELPDKAARHRLDDLLGAWLSDLRASFRIASRIAGYSSIPAPAGTVSVYELQPFPDDEVSRLIEAWELPADVAARVREYASAESTAGMTRIPLLVTLLCAAAHSDADLPRFTAGIYERVLRSFLAQENRWPQVPESDSSDIDQLLGILAPLAFHFASLPEGWADQMLGAQVMSVIRSLDPLFTEAGGDAAAILRRLSVESGVLVPVVTPGSGRNRLYQFLHRSIAEYLVAWHLATLPRAEWLETVRDHLFFDPDWQPALSMLGAAFVLQQHPGEASFLLSFLLDQDDDPFDRAIFTAARVTAELPTHDFLPQDLTDRLAKRLTWLIDEDPGSQAAEELLARYLARLPWPITERLLASLQTSGSPCYPRILASSRDPRVTSRLVALLDDDARAETIYSALHAQQCDEFIEAMLSRFDDPQQQAAAVKVLRTYQDDWHVAETMALALDGPFRTAALDVLRTCRDARLTGLWRGLAGDDDADVRSMAVGWLAEHAQTDVTDVMRARAEDSDVFVQDKALTALLESDATGLDVVLEFARRPSRYARTRAAEALARHPESAEAGAALIELAGDGCVAVRYWAARSLGSHPTDDAAAALLSLLDDEECAAPSLEALKSHNRPHVRAQVIDWVAQDPGPDRFLAAVETLAAMSSPETTKILADRTTHQAEKVRQAAVRALAGQDSKAAASALLARLTDASSSVRRAAAVSLAPLTDRPEVVTALLAHLTDEDAEVRAEVVRALPLSDRHPDVVSRLLPLLADHGDFWRSAVAAKLDGSSSVMALRWIGEASDLHRAPGLAEVSEAIEHLADRAFGALTRGERESVLRRLAVLSLRREPVASGEPTTTGSGPETTTMPGSGNPAETGPGQNSWSTPGIGKYFSPDVVNDEYLEVEIVILLQGANLYGNRVYSYVKMLGRRLRGMFDRMQRGENFKPADFGEVLAAGLGEPPPDIRDMMQEKFNMTEVELTPRPVTTFMPRFLLYEDGAPEAVDSTCGPVPDDGSGGREEKTVILLQGYASQGERVYVYLRLPRGRVDDVRAKMPAAEEFRPADFGTVLRAGPGEPPPEIHQMLADVYGRIDNWAEALESRHGFDERLTEPARQVLALAGESAGPHGHDHVGTERILLSMIREGGGVAARVLESLGMNLAAVSRRAEEITGWRPALPSATAAATDRHLPQDQASDVPALTPEAAAAYLMSRTGDQDTMAARELAAELAGLPRALEQAVVYVSATRTTLARYLSLLRACRAALAASAEDDTGGAPTPMAAALSLTLTLVADQAPPAAALVRLLSFLAPEPIPPALLLSGKRVLGVMVPDVAAAIGPLLSNPVATVDAIVVLERYHLVIQAEDGMVLVPPTVQAAVRSLRPADEEAWARFAVDLVERAVPAEAWQPITWPTCTLLLPHAQAILGLTSNGMWRMADYLGHSGNYPAARDLLQLITDAHARDTAYGPEHRDTLTARHQLARWTGEAGDAAAARDQLAALLPVRERLLGPDDYDTISTRHEIARFTGLAGNAAAARDQYAELLPLEEALWGLEGADTLTTRHNAARWTGEAGDAATARDLLTALLPIEERVNGPENFRVLISRHELARWTGRAGDAAAARNQLTALLPVQERILGPRHPRTVATRRELDHWKAQASEATADSCVPDANR
jgi:HEAT repeat protein